MLCEGLRDSFGFCSEAETIYLFRIVYLIFAFGYLISVCDRTIGEPNSKHFLNLYKGVMMHSIILITIQYHLY